MGCSNNKNSRQKKNFQRNQIQIDDQKIFYTQMATEQEISLLKGSYEIVSIQTRAYILNWYSNYLVIFDLQEGKNTTFNLQGNIQCVTVENSKIIIFTSQRFYELQFIDDKIKILRQIINIQNISTYNQHQIFYYQNLIFQRKNDYLKMIKLRVQLQPKKIFKIKIDPIKLDEFLYSNSKGILVYCFNQQYVEIFDLISKMRKRTDIRVPYQSFIYLKHMKIVEKNIELVLQVLGKGLYLYTINYQSGSIQATKYLYYDIRFYQVHQDNLLLALSTLNFYVTFNKDYNIFQKFEINFINQVLNKQNVIKYCLRKLSNFIILEAYKALDIKVNIQVYKQSNSLNQGDIWIREVYNYQLELDRFIGDPLISSNQQYLALGQEKSLILYQIEENIEKQYFFNQKIKFLGFGANSFHSYLAISNMIFCVNFSQNMKVIYRQINKDAYYQQRNLSVCQENIFTVFDCDALKLYSQQRKQIFRLKTQIYYYRQRQYQITKNLLMVYSDQKILIYSLADRKEMINFIINNKSCRLLQNDQQMIILTNEGQLQLFHLGSGCPIFQRIIIDNIQFIYKQPFNRIFLKTQQEVLIYDMNLNFEENIQIQAPIMVLTQCYVFLQKPLNFYFSPQSFELVKRK